MSEKVVAEISPAPKLEERAAQLDADRAVLESRVKVFQDKVAALSA